MKKKIPILILMEVLKGQEGYTGSQRLSREGGFKLRLTQLIKTKGGHSKDSTADSWGLGSKFSREK